MLVECSSGFYLAHGEDVVGYIVWCPTRAVFRAAPLNDPNGARFGNEGDLDRLAEWLRLACWNVQ
jgi:hypothetical protein